MISNEYQFEFKASGKVVGIPEEYKVLEKENIRTIKLVTGIDVLGRITNPYIYDINRGFIATRAVVTNIDEANVFCRSHKPLYMMIADISVICKGNIKLDLDTGLVIPEKSTLNFFVPKAHTGNIIICSKLANTKGYGNELYPIDQLQRLESSFYRQLNIVNTKDRMSFLCARILDERR